MAESKLPRTLGEWASSATRRAVIDSSIHDHPQQSGSKVEEPQFLLLRAVWPASREAFAFKEDCKSKRWIDSQNLSRASSYLNSLDAWNKYIGSLGQPQERIMGGTFALVHYYQRLSTRPNKKPSGNAFSKVDFSPRVTRSQARRNPPQRPETPTRAPRGGTNVSDAMDSVMDLLEDLNLDPDAPNYSSGSSPLSTLSGHSPTSGENAKNVQTEDEQIVNTALILLLNALTLHCDLVQGEWSLYRQPFVVKKANDKVYEARVDGLLRINQKNTRAIIEVKPFIRNASPEILDGIRMQETAQMAAWIAQDPPPLAGPASNRFTRLLVSQDHGEIYLIIASFNAEYVEYICARSVRRATKDSFLEMNEYGPFFVKDFKHMKQLGAILLAVSIQGGL